MNKIYVKLLFSLTLLSFNIFFYNCIYGYEKRNVAVLYTEEKINDMHFAEKLQVVNGTKKYSYTIDNRPVSYEEYLDQIVQAEAQVRKQQREYEHQIKNLIADAAYKINIKTGLQDLKDKLKELESELMKINTNRLRSYMVFKDSTFSNNEEFLDISQRLIPEVQDLLSKDEQEINYRLIGEYVTTIDELIPRVRLFFADTINNAVETSDDTKMLKELLSVVV